MKIIVKIVYGFFSFLLLFYLAKPNIAYPDPPPDSLQSQEPGDTETPLRRAYFTNFDREEVLSHYLGQLDSYEVMRISFPTYRLNYPPEEAQLLIRDQTRSTFLEEIIHPLRESFYVNGFEPTEEKDQILIEGKRWRQKITVRLVPSNIYLRVLIGVLVVFLIRIMFGSWVKIKRELI